MSVVVPDVRLMLILRDPVERFLSQFRYSGITFKSRSHFSGVVKGTLARWRNSNCSHLNADETDLKFWYNCYGCPQRAHKDFPDNYLVRGVYLVQIKWWLTFFDKTQLWIMDSNRLKNNTKVALKETYEWLGVDSSTKQSYAPIHVTKIRTNPDVLIFEEGLKYLYEFYHPWVVALRDFMVREFGSKWESLDLWPSASETFEASRFLTDM
eukprot:TRINITY_DN25801_c0_g1_i1.p2 TRINITY_DN25801_c0_g1~~TRINITY_DN25801_c0_g1_i1.p2  ORF type:complete len:210 (-),score=20.81 TRINITY_DN25801_c0_g1_i1:392-1021(-)